MFSTTTFPRSAESEAESPARERAVYTGAVAPIATGFAGAAVPHAVSAAATAVAASRLT